MATSMEVDGDISNLSIEEVSYIANDTSEASLVPGKFSSLSVKDVYESEEGKGKDDKKDLRKIARKYQLDLCERAMKENIIVVLETGCGKTHIAVLLINKMASLIRKPQKDICVFLAHTVALAQQQAKVIQDSTDFEVGLYCGNNKHLKNRQVWEKEMETCEVFVMTPQILLHSLIHCLIRIEQIALLIFDECHYAQFDSNHPYAEIMKVFYKSDAVKLPRVFGMTASPKLGKDTSIDTLELLLHSKVVTVDNREELNEFVVSPEVKVHYYDGFQNDTIYRQKLDEIRLKCVSSLKMKEYNQNSVNNTKKALLRLQNNLIFCLQSLGVHGAYRACSLLMEGDQSVRSRLIEEKEEDNDDSLCNKYLAQAASLFGRENVEGPNAADSSIEGVLEEPFFSRKLLILVGILSNFRIQTGMKCIIFVNRIVTARSLTCILRRLSILSSWRCDFLVGVHSGSGNSSRKNMYAILEKFRSGELNLLVATKVGEEGLDIQTCCLVVRFDLPETMCSFIQSRGRARMSHSEYAILVDRGNTKEMNLVDNFMKQENEMNWEIASRTSPVATFVDFDEKAYTVASTGATLSCGSSVSLLYRYCAKLPRDEYFIPQLKLFYFDDTNGIVCSITFPSNAPIHQVVGSPQVSREESKKDACLKACKELHKLGALTDYLLPEQDDENDELDDFLGSESSNDPMFRRELHEMIVPALLKESWSLSDKSVSLNSYYIKFNPSPADREYKRFGLFLKSPLPKEAERMKLTLCLSHGRSVATEFSPFGLTEFDQKEILQAQHFQKILLKAVLDRSELIPDFISIENDEFSNISTFYLLLPVAVCKYEESMTVDWSLVRRSLSSPMFQTPTDVMNFSLNDNDLHLVNGSYSRDIVVNSLVFAPIKKIFFLVAGVVLNKDAHSLYKGSTTHVQHYKKRFGIDLSYPCQPLLKAKQLFHVDNLLRKGGCLATREKEEHFVELPPEICQLKIIGFSKDIASSMSLLPSIMHRLENLLVAIELKKRLSSSFPEGAEVSAARVLEALTTEKCAEHFSLERLEILGDAFLKFAVGRHLFLSHPLIDEGQLTRKRSNIVKNSNLFKLATMKKLQVYIRDEPFDPIQFFALGRPCTVTCDKDTEFMLHSVKPSPGTNLNVEVKCNKGHHWLYKKTIADVIESLVGAFIVDSGFKAAIAFLKWVGIQMDFEPSQVSKICQSSTVFTTLIDRANLSSIESSMGYQFHYQGLLVQAFIHPSYNNPLGGCYQRLEFLGDAVLDYLITSYLFSVYPKLTPGQLTDLRSFYVNNVAFARVSIARSFQKFILCDCPSLIESMNNYIDFVRTSSMEKCSADGPSCPKALGDLVESCIGAILLDTGFDLNCVWKILLNLMEPVTSCTKVQFNQLREFVELCQFHHWDLQFSEVKKNGKFIVEAKVLEGENILETASAINISKKGGQRVVSEQLYFKLKAKGYTCKSQSLEEILKSSDKMEPRLIGNDEAPMDVTSSDEFPIDNLKLEEVSKIIKSGHKEQQPSPSAALHNKSATSILYEICSANTWKPPSFECINESGPGHQKEFIFQVIVEIDECSQIVQAFGEPRSTKKEASCHAAEGAVWCIRNLGY
ncbi:dicer-like protein 4 [Impatiens glandulifera]|uniref:dicer-like protein 4 n=1 Tax=Impatiens glandulifera TaxID=253017 RepID=UPI001FB148BB|nr:dicer-like protein 4 [Impatiens glandulifera]